MSDRLASLDERRRTVADALDDGTRVLGEGELAGAASTLARAFHDDPVHRWLFPNEWEWRGASRRFWHALGRRADRHGVNLGADGHDGVSVWFPPAPTHDTGLGLARFKLEMVAIAAWRSMRLVRIADALERHLPTEPCWYLAIVGVDPDRRGRGLSRRVIAPVLRVADEAGVMSYLESSNPDNVPLYEHYGFEVTGEIHVPGGPTLWSMARKPGAR